MRTSSRRCSCYPLLSACSIVAEPPEGEDCLGDAKERGDASGGKDAAVLTRASGRSPISAKTTAQGDPSCRHPADGGPKYLGPENRCKLDPLLTADDAYVFLQQEDKVLYTPTPSRTMVHAEFMHKIGSLKNMPES